jgi:uncharacterized membrane protein YczE
VIQLYAGLLVFAFGEALIVRASLGVIPWDVLHQGLVHQFGLTIGRWSIIIGAALDVFLHLLSAPGSVWVRGLFLALGILINGVATAAYIGARLGPGPRDGLMTGLVRTRGWSVRIVRTGIEVAVVVIGWLLGGNLGVGTVLFALAIGPVVHVALPLLTVPEAPVPPDEPLPDSPL